MPVLRCSDCGALVAWRGKPLAVPCPGDHPDHRRPTLHVDRDRIRRNGHAIEYHRPTYVGDARRADRDVGRALVATNRSKAG